MKCEKCGKEACFHYQSNINGEKTEYHLCGECAREQGFGEMMTWEPRPAFGGFWSSPFEGSLTGGFFGSPFGGFMVPAVALPGVSVVVGEPGALRGGPGEDTGGIPEDAGREIRSRRELAGLRHQLKAAVRAEEYEKAAELRDKIRAMEK